MSPSDTGRFDIPEAHDAIPIEETVAKLRKDISSECSGLLDRTMKAGSAKGGVYRVTLWKSKINRILEVKDTTFSIGELEGLLQECRILSRELKQHGQ